VARTIENGITMMASGEFIDLRREPKATACVGKLHVNFINNTIILL